MPTQEERLDTVEFNLRQFKTETVKVYQDMALEMTIIKGLTEDTIRRLSTLSSTIEKRFDGVDQRFEGIDTRLGAIDTRLDTMDTHLGAMDTRLDRMDTRLGMGLDTMDTHLGAMDTRLDRVEGMLVQILEYLSEKP